MDDQDLTALLHLHREKPLPALPLSFQEDVLRAIRRRSVESACGKPGWLKWLLEPFRQPLFAEVSLSFAMLIGTALGAYAIADDAQIASRALDLEVFMSRSPALPSTLLHPRSELPQLWRCSSQ